VKRQAILVALVSALTPALAGSADAATNGRIFFHGPDNCIVASLGAAGTGFNCVLTGGSTETAGPGGEPSVAPDNQHIAFTDRDELADIAVMNLNGSAIRQVTHLAAPPGAAWRGNRRSSWSPDSRRIAYSQYDSDRPGVYVINADGSGQTLVAPGGGGVPSFSPDGRTLAFEHGGIALVDSGGGSERVILPNQAVRTPGQVSVEANSQPRFSPDGSRIVFARTTGTQGAPPSVELYAMNPDGSGVTQLTATGDADESSPSFSPDGTKIVYVRRPAGVGDYELTVDNAHVAVMNADGSGQHEIAPGGEPVWSTVAGGPKRPKLRILGVPRRCFKLDTKLRRITKELALTFRVKTTVSRHTSIRYTTFVDGQEAGFASGFLNPPSRKAKNVWTGGGGIPIFQIRKRGTKVKVLVEVGGVESVSRSFRVRRC
jgi:WD40 repeat protein